MPGAEAWVLDAHREHAISLGKVEGVENDRVDGGVRIVADVLGDDLTDEVQSRRFRLLAHRPLIVTHRPWRPPLRPRRTRLELDEQPLHDPGDGARAADGEVDHVHAISYRLVDGGQIRIVLGCETIIE